VVTPYIQRNQIPTTYLADFFDGEPDGIPACCIESGHFAP
jgi:hypothetical protein